MNQSFMTERPKFTYVEHVNVTSVVWPLHSGPAPYLDVTVSSTKIHLQVLRQRLGWVSGSSTRHLTGSVWQKFKKRCKWTRWYPASHGLCWLAHVAERTGGRPATFTVVDSMVNSYGFLLFSWNREYQPRRCQPCVTMVFSDTLLPLGRRRLRLVPLRSASVATVTQNTSHVRGSSPQHRGCTP